MTTDLIFTQSFDGFPIEQRVTDGYLDATGMCKASGKQFNDYYRLKTTSEFLVVLSRSTGIHGDVLVDTRTVGANDKRGTWVHPYVAINLGQWLSPEFAVWVSQLVFNWMSLKQNEEMQTLKAQVLSIQTVQNTQQVKLDGIGDIQEQLHIAKRYVIESKLFTTMITQHDDLWEWFKDLKVKVFNLEQELKNLGKAKPKATPKTTTRKTSR